MPQTFKQGGGYLSQVKMVYSCKRELATLSGNLRIVTTMLVRQNSYSMKVFHFHLNIPF